MSLPGRRTKSCILRGGGGGKGEGGGGYGGGGDPLARQFASYITWPSGPWGYRYGGSSG